MTKQELKYLIDADDSLAYVLFHRNLSADDLPAVVPFSVRNAWANIQMFTDEYEAILDWLEE